MHSYCTYFDKNYLDRGLALWLSLNYHAPSSHLYICCLDSEVFFALAAMKLDDVTLVNLSNVEELYPNLLVVKPTRSKFEYYFTITASWIRYILDKFPGCNEITYLDSDLCFFSDPEPLFSELYANNGNVGIIAHRFSERNKAGVVNGIYNVGWLTFTRSPNGYACLVDWQLKCIEWCFDRVDGDRFADQKYLDSWPARFGNVVVLGHLGANVALWNLEDAPVHMDKGKLAVNQSELIFYHFHGLSQISRLAFFTNAGLYGIDLDEITRKNVYRPYITALHLLQKRLKKFRISSSFRYKYTKDDIVESFRNPMNGRFMIVLPFPFRPKMFSKLSKMFI